MSGPRPHLISVLTDAAAQVRTAGVSGNLAGRLDGLFSGNVVRDVNDKC